MLFSHPYAPVFVGITAVTGVDVRFPQLEECFFVVIVNFHIWDVQVDYVDGVRLCAWVLKS